MNRKRQSAGTPTGGQFAPDPHDESSLDLSDDIGRVGGEIDYDHEAEAFLRGDSGLGDWDLGEAIHSNPGSYAEDSIGFNASGSLGAMDHERLPPPVATKIAQLPPSEKERTVNFTSYARPGTPRAMEVSQFVSVKLTEDEQGEVVDMLHGVGESHSQGFVASWSDGDPESLDQAFEGMSMRRSWDYVAGFVKAIHHRGAGRSLEIAEEVRTDLSDRFAENLDHLRGETGRNLR